MLDDIHALTAATSQARGGGRFRAGLACPAPVSCLVERTRGAAPKPRIKSGEPWVVGVAGLGATAVGIRGAFTAAR